MSTNIIVYIKVKEAIDNQMAYIIPDYPWILIPKSTCTVIETVEHVEELERQIKYLQAPLNTYEIEESVTMKHVQPEPKLISKVVPKEGEIWKYYNDHFMIGIIKGESCQVKGLDGNKWNCEYPIKYFISNDNWTRCSEPEPKIIAKAGEWVKIVEWGTCYHHENQFSLNKPYRLSGDLYDGSEFYIFQDNKGDINGYSAATARTMKFEHCSAPEPQRKSLGMYDGVELFDNTDAWFVDLKELKIVRFDHMKHYLAVAGSESDLYDYSKMYLIPKEANARLKEIVREKANDYPVSITVKQWLSNRKHFIDYAIEAFEKDHNITYLPE